MQLTLCKSIITAKAISYVALFVSYTRDALFCSAARLDGIEDLALGFASLQIQMAFGGLIQRECSINANIELSILEPTKDLIGAGDQFLSSGDVIQKLGAGNVGGLSDQSQDGEGRNCARGIAERDEDTTVGQTTDGDVHSRLADAINDGLASLSIGNLHNLGNNVHRFVVLIRRSGNLIENKKLITAKLGGNVLLALAAGANHLVSTELGHLRGPLARSTADAMDEAPVSLLDEIGVRRAGQVVSGEALHNTSRGGIKPNALRNGKELGGRNRRILGIRTKDRIGDAITNLDSLGGSLIRNSSDGSATLLSTNKGQIASVQTLAVVRVNKVDTSEVVLHNDLTSLQSRGGKIGLHLESMSVTNLTDDSGLSSFAAHHVFIHQTSSDDDENAASTT